MTVYLVGAGPGDPGLVTVRGAELLRRADVVLYDRLSVASLLALAPDGAEPQVGTREALRRIWAVPALRWTALVTVALALGFYAQFEAGLPAYALTVLNVEEQTIGLAAAVNSVVIVALQFIVVRLTARRSAASLLVVVGLTAVCFSIAQWVTRQISEDVFEDTGSEHHDVR